jgi:type I restriction enzyme S subunit
MINTRYLFHFLDTYLEKLREQSIGGVIKYIKLENLTDAQIPLPPLATQKRIAEILDAADALRRKDQELLKKYDELAQAIFIDMFGDPVKNEMGWDVKKIGSITKVGSGSTPSRQINSYFMGSIPWVKTTEVNGGIITSTEEMISDDALKNSSCKLYPQNSVIIAMYGQGKTRGQVALLGIQATTNQACGVILPCSELNPKFLFNYLKLSYSELRNLGRGGNQENLNKGMIEDYIVMIPPIELQLEFNCIIDSLLNQKTNLKVVKSESLFNSLIQKAFKGELVL